MSVKSISIAKYYIDYFVKKNMEVMYTFGFLPVGGSELLSTAPNCPQ